MLNLQSVAKLNELRISENLVSIRHSRQELDNLTTAQNSCNSAMNTVGQSQQKSGCCALHAMSENNHHAHSFDIFRQHQSFSLFCAALDVKIQQFSQKLSDSIGQRQAEINALLTKNRVHQHKRDVALEKIQNDKKTKKLISESYDMSDCEDKMGSSLSKIRNLNHK